MTRPDDGLRSEPTADEPAADVRIRRAAASTVDGPDAVYVPKVYAYVTRNRRELLVFEGPEHDRLQVPKGTVELREPIREALAREVREESGLGALGAKTHLVTDVWRRRRGRRYVRHFYHAPVYEPRDRWTHEVAGAGDERELEFEFSWVALPPDRPFALDADDYLSVLGRRL